MKEEKFHIEKKKEGKKERMKKRQKERRKERNKEEKTERKKEKRRKERRKEGKKDKWLKWKLRRMRIEILKKETRETMFLRYRLNLKGIYYSKIVLKNV